MRQKNLIILLLILAVLTFSFVYFKPIKLERYTTKIIDANNLNNIKITEVFTAQSSKDYVITDIEGFTAIIKLLGQIRVQRNIFTPSIFSIQPYKSYDLLFIDDVKDNNRNIIHFHINPGQNGNMYINIDGINNGIGIENNFRIIEPLVFKELSDVIKKYAK